MSGMVNLSVLDGICNLKAEAWANFYWEDSKTYRKVTGPLTWYATGIPMVAKVVSSLHVTKHHI